MTQYPVIPGSPSVNAFDFVRDAFEIMAAGAPQVAKDLLDVSHNSKNDLARVAAAQAVMDRIGLPARIDVGITATHLVGVVQEQGGEAVDRVKERLAQLRAAQQQQQAEMQAENDGDGGGVVVAFPTIIKGEVDEDS